MAFIYVFRFGRGIDSENSSLKGLRSKSNYSSRPSLGEKLKVPGNQRIWKVSLNVDLCQS